MSQNFQSSFFSKSLIFFDLRTNSLCFESAILTVFAHSKIKQVVSSVAHQTLVKADLPGDCHCRVGLKLQTFYKEDEPFLGGFASPATVRTSAVFPMVLDLFLPKYCVHKDTARYVLSYSKPFELLSKALACRGETSPKSSIWTNLSVNKELHI